MDRGRPGAKHHLVVDAGGIPLACVATAANVSDVTMLETMVEAIPALSGGRRGRPRRRPRELYADRAFDCRRRARWLRSKGIRPKIAQRGEAHGSGLGTKRFVVERTISWLHNFGRLRVRRDRRADIHDAWVSLGCAMICLRRWEALC